MNSFSIKMNVNSEAIFSNISFYCRGLGIYCRELEIEELFNLSLSSFWALENSRNKVYCLSDIFDDCVVVLPNYV